MLTKITVEAALNAELDDHLGFERHEQSEADNNRNGYSSKTIRTEAGQFERNTPRDRAGSFEPRLVKKHQRRFTSMGDKIIFLYAQRMTTREIVTIFKEMYGADISVTLISKVTDAAIEQVIEWQSWSLEAVYPIVYLDCIVVKIRQDKKVINKALTVVHCRIGHTDTVHPAIQVRANMRLHSKVPLIAFPGLAHIRVTLFSLVLGRTRRMHYRCIYNTVFMQQQTLLL